MSCIGQEVRRGYKVRMRAGGRLRAKRGKACRETAERLPSACRALAVDAPAGASLTRVRSSSLPVRGERPVPPWQLAAIFLRQGRRWRALTRLPSPCPVIRFWAEVGETRSHPTTVDSFTFDALVARQDRRRRAWVGFLFLPQAQQLTPSTGHGSKAAPASIQRLACWLGPLATAESRQGAQPPPPPRL